MEICPYKHTVQYYETDRMGITHHSNYIRWMEEARVDFLEQAGWGYDKLEEAGTQETVCTAHSEHCFLDTEGHLVRLKKTAPGFCDMLCRMAEAYEN